MISLTALGVRTALGGPQQMPAAIRAGIKRFVEHPLHLVRPTDQTQEEWGPMIAAPIPDLDPDLIGAERLAALAVPALLQALDGAGISRAELARTSLIFALPADPVLGEATASLVLRTVGLGKVHHAVVSGGHAAVPLAIQAAGTALAERSVAAAIVVAVDSLLDPERVPVLDEAYRLRSERAPDGTLPGEAAVALVLRPAGHAGARLRILAVGLGDEPNHQGTDRISSGIGLSAAVRAVFAAHADRAKEAGWVLSDLNGEGFRHFEWGVVSTRLAGELPDHVLTHPADALGDVGAAAGGLHLAIAAEAFSRRWAPSPTALAWCAADDGRRACLLLTRE